MKLKQALFGSIVVGCMVAASSAHAFVLWGGYIMKIHQSVWNVTCGDGSWAQGTGGDSDAATRWATGFCANHGGMVRLDAVPGGFEALKIDNVPFAPQ